MSKSKKGFAVFETLLLVVIVAVIGGVGWYALHTKHQTDKILSQADKISQSTPVKSSNTSNKQNYLDITEWGVKLSIKDADKIGYSIDPTGNILNFSVKDVSDAACSSLGIHIQRGRSNALKDTLLNSGKPLDGYYYAAYGDQSGCTDFPFRDTVANELVNTQVSKL